MITKDEWIQKAKAFLFDISLAIDNQYLRAEAVELIEKAGGYNYMVESSETPLRNPDNWDSKGN